MSNLGFEIGAVVATDKINLPTHKRGSKYQGLFDRVAKLPIGKSLVLKPAEGASPANMRASIATAFQTSDNHEHEGTIYVRVDAEKNLVISHMPKRAARVSRSRVVGKSPQALPAKAAKRPKATKKATKKAAKRSTKKATKKAMKGRVKPATAAPALASSGDPATE